MTCPTTSGRRFLDQANINNAYVSGMKEDLGLWGNELNLFTTYFNIAYCIMLIPSQVIMTYVRPSWWLPSLEVIWGVITGLVATTTSARQVYVLRVFLGLCESAAYPGMITLFMSWYTPREMARRIGLYHSCQAIGQMMSGAMQASIVKTMDGRHDLVGWRRTFSTWLVYVVGTIYIAMVLGTSGYNYFGLFLKSIRNSDGSPRWTTVQVNLIPIGGSAINVVFALIAIVVAVILSLWTTNPDGTPLPAAYAAYFMSHVPLGTAPLIWAWLSDLAPQEPEERSLTVGAAIAGYYSISAWSQVLVWPASRAPYYKYSWQSSIAVCALVVVLAVCLRVVDAKHLRCGPRLPLAVAAAANSWGQTEEGGSIDDRCFTLKNDPIPKVEDAKMEPGAVIRPVSTTPA
ncbi:Major facilitator superfamily domain, general substrate transporter [Metarhizium album ARSEF 1941]|uniref:Major facilitator superfamily domain, general substrate transporter n=1 Tax=Metarhizium album (strain ARSEF 1941) TaxID=1081103 RepID=A0A0B2WLY1_METAS|nr:Major facilitator superfamily domain, general substrate transporter [Metarhizium album ARSEF 1941]KHN94025.1 Major facilitator superfamily domain, general substrate transporter [Metarhizium album ARSEF 1941]